MDVTLVLGGARSGKSAYAEGLLASHPAPRIYVATAEARDEEMRQRIAQHRSRRRSDWVTVEEPLDIATALTRPDHLARPLLVDCLTLWVSNLLLSDADIGRATQALVAALAARRAPTVLVANEVGLGIVPDNALARRFRDAAGTLNQQLAKDADHVVFMVAGLALTMK